MQTQCLQICLYNPLYDSYAFDATMLLCCIPCETPKASRISMDPQDQVAWNGESIDGLKDLGGPGRREGCALEAQMSSHCSIGPIGPIHFLRALYQRLDQLACRSCAPRPIISYTGTSRGEKAQHLKSSCNTRSHPPPEPHIR